MQNVDAPIAAEMAALAARLQALCQEAETQHIVQHWHQTHGKQVRPRCVLLAAGACGGVTDKAQRAALLVTLLHHASLVHDDVVDGASQRRGRRTIHTVWDSQTAILFGDYLLAKALCLATEHQDHDLLRLLAEAALAMSQGEFLQLTYAHRLDTTEATCLEIVHQKTAQLFSACFGMGALAAGAPQAQVEALQRAGLRMGMAFQIRDDVLDYGTAATGKPQGMDIREGKITLPLTYALQHAAEADRQRIQDLITTEDPYATPTIVSFVRHSMGLEAARRKAHHYGQAALQELQILPESPYKAALQALIRWLQESC